MASGDNFTTCGFGGSVVPPPQAVSATIDSNVKNFLMVSFLG
jgi:acyl CoA:acetate/3-ketoacid CoA transferase alpha subunit